MNLKEFQEKNPQYKIKDVHDSSFLTYGRIVNENIEEAISYVSAHFHPPKNGNNYLPSVKSLEDMSSIQTLSKKVYGYLDVMAGVVAGNNHVLNGIEYHQGSETIVAVTDFIYVVGHIWDMKGKTYHSSLCEYFYVPQATIIESYSTTLHYTPICVDESGFVTICLLLKGTGDTIERCGILKKKNKWFIAHESNIEKVESGDYPGLDGELIEICL